jgi:isoquinoline 1-oxidoreductase beta subunit
MISRTVTNVSRRRFLQGTALATGGLVLGFHLPGGLKVLAAPGGEPGRLNGFVQIGHDESITITLTHAEMGQGVHTSLPMILAEELDVDWHNVRVLQAPAVADGPIASASAGTGGSKSVRREFDVLSRAGAAAREMLRQAAANRWNVPVDQCFARQGVVRYNDKSATYGDLAMGAAMLAVPENVTLKDRADWTLLGKPTKRLDSRAKVDGSAVFGVDVQLDNMLVGTVQQCPVWGGKLVSVEPAPALAVSGVQGVFTTETAIIVVGSGYWPAKKGLDALVPVWDMGPQASNDDGRVQGKLDQALKGKTAKVVGLGNIDQANKYVSRTVQAVYEVPFLHQATMEPMNATAWVHDGKIDVWAPVQSAGRERVSIAQEFGVLEENVTVNVTFLGGGFGRRSSMDFIRPAIIASKQTDRPVKVIWSREEDMSHGTLRPVAKAQFQAGMNVPGLPVTWDNRLVVPSISRQLAPDRVNDGIDPVSVYGADDLPYAIPHRRLGYAMPDTGVRLGFWRSVPHSYNAFFVESFMDEIAVSGSKDPFEIRQQLLADKPRHLAVLDRLRQESNWDEKLAPRHFRGLAFHECFGSLTGEVVEVSMHGGLDFRLERITAVVDCGAAINPLTIEAQIEGGIVYGLTAAMFGRIDIFEGQTVQKNFDTYQMIKMAQMPPVDVHILEGGPLGGIGEPGVPPIAPALANALFRATGTRVRKLPIADAGFSLLDRIDPV